MSSVRRARSRMSSIIPNIPKWLESKKERHEEVAAIKKKIEEGYSWIEETYHGVYPSAETRWNMPAITSAIREVPEKLIEQKREGVIYEVAEVAKNIEKDIVENILKPTNTFIEMEKRKKRGIGILVLLGLVATGLYAAMKVCE